MLLLLATLSASAQLVCTQQAKELGRTAYRIPITATFEVANSGRRQIEITDVKLDCGCTKYSVAKSILEPNERTTISLTYDAAMLGHFVKQASVEYSGGKGSPLQLSMSGVVLTELKDYSSLYPYAMGDLLTDNNVVEFDDVNKGDHPELEMTILNNSQQVMTPNVQHLPSYLSAFATPEHLKPGQSGKLTIMLLSEHLPDFGLNQTTVYLASQLGEKISPDNELPVSVVLLPNLQPFEGKNLQYAPKMTLSSSVLEVGNVDGKKRKKAQLMITNTGRLPLEISSLQMFTRGLKVTLDKQTLQPHEKAKLKIVADLDVLKKSRTKPRILMITNAPEQPKVIIPIKIL